MLLTFLNVLYTPHLPNKTHRTLPFLHVLLEGEPGRIHAMTLSLAVLGNAAMLVKRRVTKPGKCVRQDASRLPFFLSVQKDTQALQFLWVLDEIQFTDSSTCFFLRLHLTWAIKAKKLDSDCCENHSSNYSPLQKTAIAHSKWQQLGAWSYLHAFSVWLAYFRILGYIFVSKNCKGGGLHPPPERCSPAYRCSWVTYVISATQHYQWIPKSKLQKPGHMWKLCSVKLLTALQMARFHQFPKNP